MSVQIELDRVRNFKYGMRAISMIEKRFKKNMAKIDLDNLTMEEIAVVMWAGLYHEDKSLTPDKVMDLIDENNKFQEATSAMGEAIEEAFGTGEEIEEGVEKKE